MGCGDICSIQMYWHSLAISLPSRHCLTLSKHGAEGNPSPRPSSRRPVKQACGDLLNSHVMPHYNKHHHQHVRSSGAETLTLFSYKE